MNTEEANKLSTLFNIVEQCAKHGSFNQLSTAAMNELKKYEADPTLLGIEYDKPEPKVVEPRVDSPPDAEPPMRPGPKVIPATKPPLGPEGDGVKVPEETKANNDKPTERRV